MTLIHSEEALAGLTVADAMHTGVVTCRLDTTIDQIAALMREHSVHAVPLISTTHEGLEEPYVWGIVSDLDVLRAGLEGRVGVRARDLAGGPVISVRPSLPLRAAAQLLLDNRVRHAIVIEPDRGRPIGVLSTLDVVSLLSGPSRLEAER